MAHKCHVHSLALVPLACSPPCAPQEGGEGADVVVVVDDVQLPGTAGALAKALASRNRRQNLHGTIPVLHHEQQPIPDFTTIMQFP